MPKPKVELRSWLLQIKFILLRCILFVCMTAKPKPTDEVLENVAKKNLYYVICMLNKTATLEAKPNTPENIVKNNAYIESHVIHARMLIEFLYGNPKKAKDDDIFAAYYVDKWWENYTNKGKPLAKSKFLEENQTKAHKMAAHLTEAGSKWPVGDKGWNRIKIRDEINEIIKSFLKEVPINRISRETKLKIEKVMEPPQPGYWSERDATTMGATCMGPTRMD